MAFLDTLTKNGIDNTGIQTRDDRLKEEAILYPFFFVLTVLCVSLVVYLFLHNETQHAQQVAHLEKLLNETRAEIRDNTANAWGIKR